jgi:hypothetical protein
MLRICFVWGEFVNGGGQEGCLGNGLDAKGTAGS